MIDFKSEIMMRKEKGHVETKKRAPPVRMGERLMAHLKRWRRMDGKDVVYVINYRGKRIARPVSSWERVRQEAGLPEYITPHILRHSRATHMMKAGVDPWEAAKYLGMSVAVLEQVYGHWHPDFGGDAPNAR